MARRAKSVICPVCHRPASLSFKNAVGVHFKHPRGVCVQPSATLEALQIPTIEELGMSQA